MNVNNLFRSNGAVVVNDYRYLFVIEKLSRIKSESPEIVSIVTEWNREIVYIVVVSTI